MAQNPGKEAVRKFAKDLRSDAERQRELAVDLYPRTGDPAVNELKNVLIGMAQTNEATANALDRATRKRQ